jgi:hypothetical protein
LHLLVFIGRWFGQFDLDDWGWVNWAAVALFDAADLGPLRLLTNRQYELGSIVIEEGG